MDHLIWTMEPNAFKADELVTKTGDAYGQELLLTCWAKFRLPDDRRLRQWDSQGYFRTERGSEPYVDGPQGVRVNVEMHRIEWEMGLYAFPRLIRFSLGGLTERVDGLDPRGTGLILCELKLDPLPIVPPPPPPVLVDPIVLSQADYWPSIEIVTEESPVTLTLIMHEARFGPPLSRIDNVVLRPHVPRHEQDPYQGPTVDITEMLHDGSGVILAASGFQPRTSYYVAVTATDVKERRQTWGLNVKT